MEEQNQIPEKNLLQKNKFYFYFAIFNCLLSFLSFALSVIILLGFFINLERLKPGFFVILLIFVVVGLSVLLCMSNFYMVIKLGSKTNQKLKELFGGNIILDFIFICCFVILYFLMPTFADDFYIIVIILAVKFIISSIGNVCAFFALKQILKPRIVKKRNNIQHYNSNVQLTKKRVFLQAASTINIVVGFIGFVWLLVYTIDAGKLMAQIYNNLTLAIFLAYLIVTLWMLSLVIVSIVLLVKSKKQECQYPLGLLISSLILGYFNPLSLALLIVSLTKHSSTRNKILQGQVWLNSDEETFEYFRDKNDDSIQKQIPEANKVTKEINVNDDLFQSLIKLQKLQELKLITKNEFETMKAKIIEKM